MKLNKIAALIALAGLSASAMATNGYFSHGYGMKAKGMAGVGTTSTGDTFGGANNPAAMVWAGSRMDLGVDWFSPRREAERSGTGFGGVFDSKQTSDSNHFFVPEFGYNRMINNDMSLGITVYGNGGMNTDYDRAGNDSGVCGGGFPSGAKAANMFCGSSRLGVDLMQLIIAPTFAMKLNANHSIGISPLLAYQRFEAYGLQAFDRVGATSSVGNVTNNGHDSSHGYGLRLGWLGKITDTVTVGAAYATRMRMTKFSDYKGLFAEGGDFDMPENWNVGVSWMATPQLKLALDYQHINYDQIDSIANSSSNAALMGSSNGPGFGWRDIGVTKLGVEYQFNDALTLRGGYSWGESPIKSRDAMFNILAPGVIEDHITLGLTYKMGDGELSIAYMHAFENSVRGPDGLGAGGTDKIKMYQDSLGASYSWKFK